MFEKAEALWVRWRESRRQYRIERALFKAAGNPTGPFAHGYGPDNIKQFERHVGGGESSR